jgi:glutamate N-acetyltransferase/amino-acid N-acetyltransferase
MMLGGRAGEGEGRVTQSEAPKGFRFATAAAEMRYRGRDDVGLIVADGPAEWAGVFTTSAAAGAPVLLMRERLRRRRPVRALLVNAGIANAGTGRQGVRDARATARLAARRLGVRGREVLCASTGSIGVRLPLDRFAAVMPGLVEGLDPGRWGDVARAMMTTDLRPKTATARCTVDGREVTLLGMAKGSGMIEPHMATMLAFLLTDAAAPARFLQAALVDAVDGSFNALTVDGDMSTSDMAVVLASGAAGNDLLGRRHPDAGAFRAALAAVTLDLTRQLAGDGEGATKVIEVTVGGARSRDEARRAARAVAGSSLVKSALSGARPAWGFMVAAMGAAGVEWPMERLRVTFGDEDLVRAGRYLGGEAAAAARRHLAGPEVRIALDLGRGRRSFTYYGCDLTAEYVRINAEPAVPDPYAKGR